MLEEGEGCARGRVRLPSLSLTIYRGKGEGGRPPQIQSEEGAAARGVSLPPKARGAPPLGFPQTLGAWALGGLAPSPLRAGSLPPTAHKALRGR